MHWATADQDCKYFKRNLITSNGKYFLLHKSCHFLLFTVLTSLQCSDNTYIYICISIISTYSIIKAIVDAVPLYVHAISHKLLYVCTSFVCQHKYSACENSLSVIITKLHYGNCRIQHSNHNPLKVRFNKMPCTVVTTLFFGKTIYFTS